MVTWLVLIRSSSKTRQVSDSPSSALLLGIAKKLVGSHVIFRKKGFSAENLPFRLSSAVQ